MNYSLWQVHSPSCTGQHADTLGQLALQAVDIQCKWKGMGIR